MVRLSHIVRCKAEWKIIAKLTEYFEINRSLVVAMKFFGTAQPFIEYREDFFKIGKLVAYTSVIGFYIF